MIAKFRLHFESYSTGWMDVETFKLQYKIDGIKEVEVHLIIHYDEWLERMKQDDKSRTSIA